LVSEAESYILQVRFVYFDALARDIPDDIPITKSDSEKISKEEFEACVKAADDSFTGREVQLKQGKVQKLRSHVNKCAQMVEVPCGCLTIHFLRSCVILSPLDN
jgi:hypothetical protein